MTDRNKSQRLNDLRVCDLEEVLKILDKYHCTKFKALKFEMDFETIHAKNKGKAPIIQQGRGYGINEY